MKKALPSELQSEVIPVLQAEMSERSARGLLSVELDPMDPLAEPEPSVGALLRLDSGRLAVAVYGKETQTFSLRLPESEVSATSLRALLEEIPVPGATVRWKHPAMRRSSGASGSSSPLAAKGGS